MNFIHRMINSHRISSDVYNAICGIYEPFAECESDLEIACKSIQLHGQVQGRLVSDLIVAMREQVQK